MDILGDKYILGQSIKKTIQSSKDEISLDLNLQQSTNKILFGPDYDSFTVTSQGFIPPITMNATTGIFQGSASVAPNGKYVRNLDGFAASVSVIIYTIVAGQYNLTIDYLSGDRNTTLLINVAGASTGVTYNCPKTTNWDVSSARTVMVQLNLVKGRTLIKFFNNSGVPSPWIGDLTFAIQQTPAVIETLASSGNVIYPARVLSNGYVGAIGDDGGYVVISINIAKAGMYTLGIRYITGDRDRPMKVDVNGISTGTTYNFPKTTNWDVSSSRLLNININLNQGNNTVKLYNSPNAAAPWVGELIFTQQFFSQTIEAENTTLTGIAKVNNDLVTGVAFGLGDLAFDISVPGNGLYDLIIRYVSTQTGRTARIFINGIYTGSTYAFDTTNDWDIYKYKVIPVELKANSNLIRIS